MVVVGLWGAQLGAPAVWLLLVTFPQDGRFAQRLLHLRSALERKAESRRVDRLNILSP